MGPTPWRASAPLVCGALGCERRGQSALQSTPTASGHRCSVLIGTGGHGRLLGLDAVDAESCDGRKAFPLSLRARDAYEGLKRAIQEAFPGVARQRCIVHLMRNAAGNAPARQKRGAVPGMLMIMSTYFYPTASPLITQAGYRKLTNSG